MRQFNAANQYRTAEINIVRGKSKQQQIPLVERPFIGMALEKKGRLIDGIRLYITNDNPEDMTEPVVTVKAPQRIVLEKDNEGRDTRITVVSDDGTEASIELGDRKEEKAMELVAKVAYSIYQRRGGEHGHDQDDWYIAERKVKDTELEFVR